MFWYWADNTEQSDLIQGIVEDFNRDNGRGITVKAEEYPWNGGGFSEDTFTAVMGGGGPDVSTFKLSAGKMYAANQLLAALALLTVCAWLGNIGRNNKMFYIPMLFMLVVTLTSLAQTVTSKVAAISAGKAAGDWGPYAQAILGTLLFVLALVLAWEGIQTIFFKKKAANK